VDPAKLKERLLLARLWADIRVEAVARWPVRMVPMYPGPEDVSGGVYARGKELMASLAEVVVEGGPQGACCPVKGVSVIIGKVDLHFRWRSNSAGAKWLDA